MRMAFPNGVNHTVYILKGHVKVNGKADLARVSVHGSRVVFLLVAPICVCRKHGQGLKVDIGGDASASGASRMSALRWSSEKRGSRMGYR